MESGSLLCVCVASEFVGEEDDFVEHVLACGCFAGAVCICVSSGLLQGRTSSALWCKLANRGTGTRATLGPCSSGPICSGGISPEVTMEVAPLAPDGEGDALRG